MRYAGELYCGDTDYLEVGALIVRDSEVAFAITSVSVEFGRWESESGKVAQQQSDGTYLATQVQYHGKGGVLGAPPWSLRFKFEREEVGSQELRVTVALTEGEGDECLFEGDLQRC